MLSTEAPLGQGIESGESCGVSVLTAGAGLVTSEHIVGEAAHPGEDPWVVTDAGLIFLEGDVTRIMQRVLDVPVVLDCGSGKACRCGRVGHIVCDLGGAAPQAGLGITMQDIAGDSDDRLDQRLPLGSGHGAGRAEDVGCPGFMPVASSGDLSVTAGGVPGGAGGFDILQQSGLIILQLDEELSLRLCGGLEGFFWQCMASSVTMQCAT